MVDDISKAIAVSASLLESLDAANDINLEELESMHSQMESVLEILQGLSDRPYKLDIEKLDEFDKLNKLIGIRLLKKSKKMKSRKAQILSAEIYRMKQQADGSLQHVIADTRRPDNSPTTGASPQLTYKDIEYVETTYGSVYKYLPDGRTQRFKKVTGELIEPQDALVFIPDYQTILSRAEKPENARKVFGENSAMYEETLLEYAQSSGKTMRIVDQNGKELGNNDEIDQAQKVSIAFVQKSRNGERDKVDFWIVVSKVPQIGFYTYDTTKHKDEDGRTLRDRHMGNQVVKIGLRSGEIIA
jgi:hypothetical protein